MSQEMDAEAIAAALRALPLQPFGEAGCPLLAGVRVLDLSRLVAGNLLTLTLADHGAEVWKIEPPAGDTLRAWRTRGIETAWKTWARNKKSVCLDLRRPEAIAALRRLAARAQILVESFRPGVLEAMGLPPAALLAENPCLVILRISGWGQDGPYRHKPGFGTLVEAYSGFAAANGFADREPVLPPMFLADSLAGLMGAAAAVMALRHAERTGSGQVVDLSLFEPMFAVLEPQIANFVLTGRGKRRSGSRSTNTAPRNVYRTADGAWLALSASTQGMFAKLMHAIGRPELIEDPRFADNAARLQHAEEIDSIVAAAIGRLTRAEALALFDRAGVTVGPVQEAADLLQDAYLRERAALVAVADAEMPAERLPMHGRVPRFSATPGAFCRPAPRLGEHTAEVLGQVLGAAERDALIAAGVAFVAGAVPAAPPAAEG